MKTELIQDLTTTTKLNVLNLYAELYINLNDNELLFVKECLKNAKLDFQVMKSKNEFKSIDKALVKSFDRFLEFANWSYDVGFSINEIGCSSTILYYSEKWQFEHYVNFKTFNEGDTIALLNLLATQIYVIKEPFTKYKEKVEA